MSSPSPDCATVPVVTSMTPSTVAREHAQDFVVTISGQRLKQVQTLSVQPTGEEVDYTLTSAGDLEVTIPSSLAAGDHALTFDAVGGVCATPSVVTLHLTDRLPPPAATGSAAVSLAPAPLVTVTGSSSTSATVGRPVPGASTPAPPATTAWVPLLAAVLVTAVVLLAAVIAVRWRRRPGWGSAVQRSASGSRQAFERRIASASSSRTAAAPERMGARQTRSRIAAVGAQEPPSRDAAPPSDAGDRSVRP